MARIDEDAAEGYALAYAEAVRALSQQRESLEALRTRAGVLLSAAAITTSLLAREAVSILVLVAFGGLVASLAAILWPREGADSTVSARTLLETYVERPASVALIHRDLVHYMDAVYAENRRRYETLARHFRRATVLLGVEVILLIGGV